MSEPATTPTTAPRGRPVLRFLKRRLEGWRLRHQLPINFALHMIGIPMAVYPSFIYYNKTLFDEADLAYPPHEVGEQYEGQDWTWDTVRELAMQLTVDANGADATDPAFDALLTGEDPFDDLPTVLPRLAEGSLPALCHRIAYPTP